MSSKSAPLEDETGVGSNAGAPSKREASGSFSTQASLLLKSLLDNVITVKKRSTSFEQAEKQIVNPNVTNTKTSHIPFQTNHSFQKTVNNTQTPNSTGLSRENKEKEKPQQSGYKKSSFILNQKTKSGSNEVIDNKVNKSLSRVLINEPVHSSKDKIKVDISNINRTPISGEVMDTEGEQIAKEVLITVVKIKDTEKSPNLSNIELSSVKAVTDSQLLNHINPDVSSLATNENKTSEGKAFISKTELQSTLPGVVSLEASVPSTNRKSKELQHSNQDTTLALEVESSVPGESIIDDQNTSIASSKDLASFVEDGKKTQPLGNEQIGATILEEASLYKKDLLSGAVEGDRPLKTSKELITMEGIAGQPLNNNDNNPQKVSLLVLPRHNEFQVKIEDGPEVSKIKGSLSTENICEMMEDLPSGSEIDQQLNREALNVESDQQLNSETLNLESDQQLNSETLNLESDQQLNKETLNLDSDQQLNRETLNLESDQQLNSETLNLESDQQLNGETLNLDSDQQLNRETLNLESDQQLNSETLNLDSDQQLNKETLNLESTVNINNNVDNITQTVLPLSVEEITDSQSSSDHSMSSIIEIDSSSSDEALHSESVPEKSLQEANKVDPSRQEGKLKLKKAMSKDRTKTSRAVGCEDMPYVCSDCSKCFETEKILSIHRRFHTYDKKYPYTCSQCSRKFSNPSSLTRHLYTHLKTSECQCSVCSGLKNSESFVVKVTDSVYECDICKTYFIRGSDFESHYKKHCNKFALKCDFCDERFPFHHKLEKHLKNEHAYKRPTKRQLKCLGCPQHCQMKIRKEC